MPFLPQLPEANAGQTAKPLSLQCQFYAEQIASVSGGSCLGYFTGTQSTFLSCIFWFSLQITQRWKAL